MRAAKRDQLRDVQAHRTLRFCTVCSAVDPAAAASARPAQAAPLWLGFDAMGAAPSRHVDRRRAIWPESISEGSSDVTLMRGRAARIRTGRGERERVYIFPTEGKASNGRGAKVSARALLGRAPRLARAALDARVGLPGQDELAAVARGLFSRDGGAGAPSLGSTGGSAEPASFTLESTCCPFDHPNLPDLPLCSRSSNLLSPFDPPSLPDLRSRKNSPLDSLNMACLHNRKNCPFDHPSLPNLRNRKSSPFYLSSLPCLHNRKSSPFFLSSLPCLRSRKNSPLDSLKLACLHNRKSSPFDRPSLPCLPRNSPFDPPSLTWLPCSSLLTPARSSEPARPPQLQDPPRLTVLSCA